MDTSVQFLCFLLLTNVSINMMSTRIFTFELKLQCSATFGTRNSILSSVAELVLFDRIRLRFFPQRR